MSDRAVTHLPLLLGEAPSRTGDRYHMFPLSGAVARTLCLLAGIPPQSDGSTYGRWTWALYERFECRNVFERYAQATPWSASDAREAMSGWFEEYVDRIVVCLGRRVQAALSVSAPFYEWRRVVGVTAASEFPAEPPTVGVVAIPHPSGLNRLLNDEAERERCRVTLRQALDAGVKL